MAGSNFADWLYGCDIVPDEEEAGPCHLSPVPIRWGRRVMLCYPDRNEVTRYSCELLARAAFALAAERLEAAVNEASAQVRSLAKAC
jgi:hypothetical protein